MKNRRFFIIFAFLLTLIFYLWGYENISAALQSNVLKSSAQSFQRTASTSNDGIWDVSNVDISIVSPKRKLIALTFDDAPVKTLERIVSVFLHFNASHPDSPAFATLFCNGKNITASAIPSLQAAYAAGFELGNHTQNHQRLTSLPLPEIRQEIEKTDRILQQIDGKALHLLRAPYGEINQNVRQAANAPIIDWLIDTLDWTGRASEDVHQAVMQQKTNGAIVLLHDGYENTVLALKRLLPSLYEAGYQAVTVSQMAKAHSVPLKNGSVYIRARKLS